MKRIIAIFALLTVYATAADSSYNCTVAELTDLTGGVFEVSGRRIQKFIADPDNHEGAFIVISKADMTLTVLNTESKPLEVFPICCGAEYGDKQTVRDLRTPEGVFKVRAVDDSRLWRERYDDGTYSRPGAYGPFFIRIDYPPYHHIGIHGTNNPESIGMRDSHGCIRLNNADLTKLLPYVYENMPVIITPSLDDSEENVRFRAEGGIPDLITLK